VTPGPVAGTATSLDTDEIAAGAPAREPADSQAGASLDGTAEAIGEEAGAGTALRPSGWSGRVIAICLAIYAILAVAVFLPASPFSSTTVPTVSLGNPSWQDPFQMMWFLAYVPYALTHGAPLFHTTLIDYPRGANLADNTWVPFLGLAGWPITATLGPVATFNFLLRLSFFVSAATMFLVLRRWCRSWQGPFVAGLLYAFSPYMTAQELHLDLNFVPIPPLLLLLGDELVRRQKMKPALLGLLIGAACAVQYLLSPDVLSGCVVVALVIAIVLAVRFHSQVRARIGYIAKAGVVAIGGFLVLAGYPIFEMLAGPGHLNGPVIAVRRLQFNSADLLGPITPTSHQLFVPGFLASLGDRMVHTNLSENGAYLGIPLIIVLVLIVYRLRRDDFVATAAVGAVAALVFSFGAHLVAANQQTSIPLPGYVLSRLKLLEDTIPARYSLYVTLFAAAILAIGIDRLWPVLWAKRKAGTDPTATSRSGGLKRFVTRERVLLAGGAAAVVVTLMPPVPFGTETLPWAASLPATLSRVLPPNAEIATIPEASPQDAAPMAWQAIDGMRFGIIGGYANVQSPYRMVGQRWPYPGEPYFMLGDTPVPSYPIPANPLPLPKAGPHSGHNVFCSYIRAMSIAALVYAFPDTTTGPVVLPPGIGIDAAMSALGRPNIVEHGYAIWLTAGRCSPATTTPATTKGTAASQ
jgi:hypothetical protein